MNMHNEYLYTYIITHTYAHMLLCVQMPTNKSVESLGYLLMTRMGVKPTSLPSQLWLTLAEP